MKIEIKNRYDGSIIICGEYESVKECLEKNRNKNLESANLKSANLESANLKFANLESANLEFANLKFANLESANLKSANLESANLKLANLKSANLKSANLKFANLKFANLEFANLESANLESANLESANLKFANLESAKYKEPLFLPDLYSLKLLPPETVLHFWKYLKNGKSPYQNFIYEIGKIYKFNDCDKNEQVSCGKGGNVATLIWCMKDNIEANEFIEVEFCVKDIGAVPFGTDGKFRVKKFEVLRKITRRQANSILEKAMGIKNKKEKK